nr:FAD-dependent oxidoreductase [Geobacillus kaustophilus]
MKRKLVLIGNGMAGVRCIEEILKLDREAFEITIFGSEPHPNYNRILLSKVLQGDTRLDDITLNSWEWYEQNGIRLLAGETVTDIDHEERLVRTDRGRVVEYDELILATGSNPFILPVPGADLPGVTAFRDIQDCERMIEYAKTYKKAAVIGGGLLGLEVARGLLNLGMDVDVIHIFDYLMERQLDPTASKLLQRELEKQGMNFLLRKETAELFGNGRVEGVRFKDGTSIAADLVVMAVGIRPNVDLARRSGIEVNRGIVVNDYLETSVPHIYAVGECAEHRGVVYGLVAPLYEQGLTNEEAYLLGKFACVALKTRYIDYNGRFCMSAAAAAMNDAFGLDRELTNPLSDIPLARTIILAGTNIAECQPTLMPYFYEAKKNGAFIIVVDPLETKTAALADLHLPLKPGTDVALAIGIGKVLLKEGYIDETFVRERTVGFAEWKQQMEAVDMDEIVRVTDVPGREDPLGGTKVRGGGRSDRAHRPRP